MSAGEIPTKLLTVYTRNHPDLPEECGCARCHRPFAFGDTVAFYPERKRFVVAIIAICEWCLDKQIEQEGWTPPEQGQP